MATIAELVGKVRLDVSDVDKNSDKATKSIRKVKEGMDEGEKSTSFFSKTLGGLGQVASVAGGIIAADLLGKVVSFGQESIQASKDMQRSMITLGIISERFGVNADDAKKAANELGKELRIGVGPAAEGLQNLMKSGLGLDKSKELLKRFTNEAITGKSPTISLSQAVQNLSFAYATGNSALGNLSGVSENFADITEKGRASLIAKGVAVNTITDDMAKYEGMINLTNLTLGSADKFTGTLIDTEAKLDQQMEEIKVTIGDALAPVWNTFLGGILSGITTIKDFGSNMVIAIGNGKKGFDEFMNSDGVKWVTNTFKDTFKDIGDSVKKSWDELSKTFQDVGKSLGDTGIKMEDVKNTLELVKVPMMITAGIIGGVLWVAFNALKLAIDGVSLAIKSVREGFEWMMAHKKDISDFANGLQTLSTGGLSEVGKMIGNKISGKAEGGENIPGGWNWVGEKGPELMYVPQGSTIKPHDESMNMVKENSSKSMGDKVVNIVNNFTNNFSQQYNEDAIATKLAFQLRTINPSFI